MIGLTCSCRGPSALLVTLVRHPDEIDKMTPSGKAFCVFSVECADCKAQMFFEFFDAPAEGEQNRVEVTYKPGTAGFCTKDPNTCKSNFCFWPRCGH